MDFEEDVVNVPQPSENDKLVIEPIYSPNCRICKFVKEEVNLYNWMCQLALQGTNSHRLHIMTTEYMTTNYPDLPLLTKKSIWNHFRKHVKPVEAVEIACARREKGVANPYDPLVDQKALEAIKNGNFDEYRELCDLYVKFREVHDKIYQFADSITTNVSGNPDWSQNKIQTYVSMVNTQKSILAEISKMRQSDKLVVIVAKYVVEVFAKSMVKSLTDEFSSLGSIMKRQGVDPSVLQAFDAVTHERLARVILDEADTAMTITRKEFKLPD